MLSVLEFQSLIESGAVVHCKTKEECVKVLNVLEQLGFYIYDRTFDLCYKHTFLSPGLDYFGEGICRYNNEYVEKHPNEEERPMFYNDSSIVIDFDEVPFSELTNETSAEEFDECFARLLAP